MNDENKRKTEVKGTKRRTFVKASTAFAGISFLPSGMLFGANTPSKQFRFAQIGCAGKGKSDMALTINAGAKLVAKCDVDKVRAKAALKGDQPFYDDYRKLLDKHHKEIDGVVVSTPDHTHGCIGLDAIKRGKHVYIQKPLARTYQECQVLLEASKKYKVTTQMGNQGHSGNGLKVWKQMADEKVFGEVQHVHAWSDRPVWPQGMKSYPRKESIPSTLNWDSWTGPVALRDYSKKFLPFSWRGWWEYGAGAMGDMACHNMDPLFWIFELGLPSSVKAQADMAAGVAYPKWSIIEFKFDKNNKTGKPLTMTWYDGKKVPKLPSGIHPNRKPGKNGTLVVGSKMSVMGGSHASRPLPIAITGKEYGTELKEQEKHWRDQTKKHRAGDHYGEWIKAAKANKPSAPGSCFDYSVPFTQAILLGCIALRYPDQELKWDNTKKQFSNNSDANKWLSFKPRAGYSLSL